MDIVPTTVLSTDPPPTLDATLMRAMIEVDFVGAAEGFVAAYRSRVLRHMHMWCHDGIHSKRHWIVNQGKLGTWSIDGCTIKIANSVWCVFLR